MRCNHARRMLERKASNDLKPRETESLTEHLSNCRDCSKLDEELERIWDALGLCPGIEPSTEALPRLRAVLREEAAEPVSRTLWQPNRRWQWVALACCALFAAVLLSRNDPFRHEAPSSDKAAATVTGDRADEQFLQKLDETLQQSAEDFLSTYDTWPGAIRDNASPELIESKPAAPAAKKGRL